MYVKYGVKKLKWAFVIVNIVVSWVMCTVIGVIALFPQFGMFVLFCFVFLSIEGSHSMATKEL